MNSKEEFIRKVRGQEWNINPEDLIQFIEPAIIHLHCTYEMVRCHWEFQK
jgi:hypothetical protein